MMKATARPEWTREELRSMIPVIREKMDTIESTLDFEPRGMPPMLIEECRDLIFGLIEIAGQRPLTTEECFLHGQLLCQYRMAVQAEMLGKKDRRYFVIPEEKIQDLMARGIPLT